MLAFKLKLVFRIAVLFDFTPEAANVMSYGVIHNDDDNGEYGENTPEPMSIDEIALAV